MTTSSPTRPSQDKLLAEHKSLAERIAALSPKQRAVLELKRSRLQRGQSASKTLPRRQGPGPWPASTDQTALWFIQQLDPETSAYNIGNGFRLQGKLDVPLLERCFGEMVMRHEALRTTFRSIDGRPHQVVSETTNACIQFTDVRAEHDPDAAARPLLAEQIKAPFDLETGPLVRLLLVRIGDQDHVMVGVMHHTVTDWWSYNLFFDELFRLYEAYRRGRPNPLPEIPIQFIDWCAGREQWLRSEDFERQSAYWLAKLEGAPRVLEVLGDRPRPPVQSAEGAREFFKLPPATSRGLRQRNHDANTSSFMTLLAGLSVLLWRYTGQRDMLLGTPASFDRESEETRYLMGYLINTLLLRVDLRGDPSFRQLLEQVRTTCLEAFANKELPFRTLVEKLNPERDLSRMPLYQVEYLYISEEGPLTHEQRLDGTDMPGFKLSSFGIDRKTSPVDLQITFSEAPRQYYCLIEYNTDIFESATVRRLGGHLIRLLDRLADQPDVPISGLSLVDDHERHQIISTWNEDRWPLAPEQPLHRAFERQAKRNPGATAVRVPGQGTLTYGQLDARANRLAAHLRHLGVGPETRVGLATSRSREMMVGLYGILKAGAAYLPLDPSYPASRLELMLEDGQVAVVLTEQSLAEHLPTRGIPVIRLDRPLETTGANLEASPDPPLDAAAYLIYTSGSTGRPKGVVVSHRNATNFCHWVTRFLEREELAVTLAATSLSFDISQIELFAPLAVGGTVVLADNLLELPSLSTDLGLTLINTVPSTMRGLLEIAKLPSTVTTILLAGEALERPLVNRLHESSHVQHLINGYGPTEATVYALYQPLARGETGAVPIGRPLAATTAYVLDRRLESVPIAVPGELCVGGAGVARGYHRRPRLTAERFVPNPFVGETDGAAGSRLYRTGDLVRHPTDGGLRFLGRVDQQVKIRGFRIEPGEIEQALCRHKSIAHAAIVVRESGAGRQLVAFCVPAAGQSSDPRRLRDFLAARLPNYMVPAVLVTLDELPLTPSGKIDRAALGRRELSIDSRRDEAYRAPRTLAEELLSQLVADILALDRVGIDGNFFALGGDSIVSIQLVSRARQAGLELTPKDVFQSQTIEALAAKARWLDETSRPVWDPATAVGEVVMTPIVHWALERGGPIDGFRQSMLLQLPEGLRQKDLVAALQALLDEHDALRLQLRRATDGEWQLRIPPPGTISAVRLNRIDLRGLDEGSRRRRMEAVWKEAGSRLDPAAGRMLQAVWLEHDDVDRLLLVIHHLAVDGVSWRILVPDLAAAWAAAARGETPRLGPMSTPFRVWAEHLAEQAQEPTLLKELPTWESMLEAPAVLPDVELDPRRDVVASAEHLRLELTTELTSALLTSLPAAFHARINDVLLTALALAVADWRRQRGLERSPMAIDLEGHGREPLTDGLDLSRTVGWFTSLYPVRLDPGSIDLDEALAGGAAAGRAFKRIKEQLRAVPREGLTYGLLRYLHPEARARLASRPAPQIAFNYLGRLAAGDGGAWSADPEVSLGGGADEAMPLAHPILVDALTQDGPEGPRLSAIWSWAGSILSEPEVRALADGWQQALTALVRHVEQPPATHLSGHTPSDFPWVSLSQDQVEQLEAACPGLEDILPLSPLQEGLLFHALFDQAATDVYTVQICLELEGQLHATRMQRAAGKLLRRHPNLGVSIFRDVTDRPVQVIARDVRVRWLEIDLTAVPNQGAEQRRRLLAADRRQRFVTSEGPLLRFSRVRLDRGHLEAPRNLLIVTAHHVLIDGWSAPILLNELFTLYHEGDRTTALPPERPYADYLAWLGQQDRTATLEVWREYLEGLDEPTHLAAGGEAAGPMVEPKQFVRELSQQLSDDLRKLTRHRAVTLSTVVQGLWAVLLGRLTARSDVVFGVTVAGRPAELRGVEQMVGLFINTLPLRVRLRPEEPIAALLDRIQESQSRLMPFQHLGLAEIQRAIGLGELFDTLVVVENYPISPARLSEPETNLKVVGADGHDATHYPLGLVVLPGERLRLRLDFNPTRFEPGAVEAFAERFVRLLETVAATPELPLYRLDVLAPNERRQLLEEFNAAPRALPEATLAELFEAQVKRAPDALALTIVAGPRSLSYAALETQADRLARHLHGLGVTAGSLVALRLERSPELLIALLAVVKVGAAYLPLDLSYPRRRVQLMLADSGAEWLLTTTDQQRQLGDLSVQGRSVQTVLLDEMQLPIATDPEAPSVGPVLRPETSIARPVDPLAYVMYTSGSTGQPKGIAIGHRAVIRLVCNTDYVQLGPQDRVAQASNASFDAATFEIWGALLTGGELVILPREMTLSPPDLAAGLQQQRIDSLFLTTALFNQIAREAPQAFSGLRDLLFGGEAVDPRWVREVLARGAPKRLLHVYGPTENTTFSTWHTVESVAEGARTVPIGGPVANSSCRVLDQSLCLVPVGTAGELYLAGAGLAWGYLERPAMTAEHFIPDPYGAPDTRMYRTGDLARWRPDGALEFVGRVDHQVKIRGFRIEPGEIEAMLSGHESVAEAAVVVRESDFSKQLVAYAVPAAGISPDPEVLRQHLAERLPDYMLPKTLMRLDELPLTPNGKIDRAELRRRQPSTAQDVSDRAPRTPAEALLCQLFTEVLSLDRVGLDGNFFALGGDSIVSIQLVSRARQAGLELTPRDVFEWQTVEALASAARWSDDASRPAPDPAAAVGEVVATPILRWLFERGGPIDRFHQSMLLHLPQSVREKDLRVALQALLDGHDALRLRARHANDGEWQLRILPPSTISADDVLRRVDLQGLDKVGRQQRIEAAWREAGSRLAPGAGRMLQAVWLDDNSEQEFAAGRLLLVIHHLVVDGVSWRILVPDLASAWAAAVRGETPRLEPVGTPFRIWAEHLAGHAQQSALLAELPAWEAILDGPPLLPGIELDPAHDVVASAKHLRVELPSELTSALLTSVPAAFHGRVNDVLLTALTLVIADWRRRQGLEASEPVVIDLEGHGREPVPDTFDLSRTVGWFTSLYPVRLDLGSIDLDEALAGGAAIARAFKRIKEQLRAVPGEGLGYGLLRFLHPEVGPNLARRPTPQIGFNYLGRFVAGDQDPWSVASEISLGGGADEAMPMAHPIEINALTQDYPEGPRLSTTWVWAGSMLDEPEVRALAECWQKALTALVRHVEPSATDAAPAIDGHTVGGHTPSDFPRADLSQSQIERLEAAYPGLEDVWPLSPLQEGLHFHALFDPTAPDVYTVQICLELEGELDTGRMRRAAQELLRRHSNLGVSILKDAVERPVQILEREVEVPWHEIDLTLVAGAASTERQQLLAADRGRRFVMSEGPLLRFTLVHLDQGQVESTQHRPPRHLLIFTNHHILLDGWSVPILLGELLTLYQEGGATTLPRVRPYADYLDWLGQQDPATTLDVWRDDLAGLTEPTRLAPPLLEASPPSVEPQGVRRDLSPELSHDLQELARRRALTLSTIVQGSWATLLGRLTGRDDVVFGVTVAGRPAELHGVEQMVGLFINTLPLRVQLRPEEPVSALLDRIQANQSRLMPFQHARLAEIQHAVGLGELFDTLVVFENYPVVPAHLADSTSTSASASELRIATVEGHDATHYPLSLVMIPGERLHLQLNYDPTRFERDMVETLAARFVRLLETVAATPDQALRQFEILGQDERQVLLETWSTAPWKVLDATLPQLFESQAERAGEATALESSGGTLAGNRKLSYGELNRRANRLAHHLIGLGVGPEHRVGVALPRSPDLVVTLLATLKTGAAFLPLDPEYPEARLRQMLSGAEPAGSEPTVMVCTQALRGRLPESTPTLILDSAGTRAVLDRSSTLNPVQAQRNSPLHPQHPAYVIYTSGSTGQPKGVVVTHRALANKVRSLNDVLGIDATTRYAATTAISFDPLLEQLLCPLCAGATSLIVADDLRDDAQRFAEYADQQQLTLLNGSPGLIEVLLGDAPRFRLETLLVGGEALPARLAETLRDESVARRIFNLYGPTETCIDASIYEVPTHRLTDPVAIGSPLPGYRLYVLNAALEPVPARVCGELHIAGVGLARGYLGRPGRTAEGFLPDPYGARDARMYRTGDLARWRDDGTLEFLGRTDHQIKIRGFRIEPGEIEAALCQHEQVADARVMLLEDGASKQLLGYVIDPQDAEDAELGRRLREQLKHVLPDFMVPSAVLVLPSWPLLPNGKLDRRALPRPDRQSLIGARYVPPSTETARILAEIWQEVLSLDRVGETDDFFALGGHSLRVTQVMSRVREAFGVELPLRTLFDAPRLSDLSAAVEAFLATSTRFDVVDEDADDSEEMIL